MKKQEKCDCEGCVQHDRLMALLESMLDQLEAEGFELAVVSSTFLEFAHKLFLWSTRGELEYKKARLVEIINGWTEVKN